MIKLIKSEYEEGFSYVEIETELGIFSGTATLHNEDKKYESEFLGCAIAEMRATRYYYEKKLRRLNSIINELFYLIKQFNKIESPKSEEQLIVEKRYNNYIQQKCDILNELNSCSEKAIDKKIEKRMNFINNLEKKEKGE